MDPSAMTAEMQALLDHSHWVQELARKLVRDPNVAEDLAQETLLAALRDRGSRPRSMRAWLGTVLRNLVWERVRREDRRDAREEQTARDEAILSTGALLDRVTAHRHVVEALMTLPEHYREVLLRRYFEGESPSEIATSLALPHSTVRTRLSRATAMMRERLDARHGGDGRTWLAALVPLVDAPLRPMTRTAAASGTAVSVPLALVLGACALLLVVAGLFFVGPRDETSATVAALDPELESVAPEAPAAPGAPQPSARAAASGSPLPAAGTGVARDTLAPDRTALDGRVIDPVGAGLAGVLVRYERFAPGKREVRDGANEPIAITGAGGEFRLRGATSTGWVVAERDDLVTVFAGTPSLAGARRSLLVVAAPRSSLAGRVVDGHGSAVAGARVSVELPASLRPRLGVPLDASAPVPLEVETDARGAFALDVPRLAGLEVVARAEGFAERRVPAAGGDTALLELERLAWSVGTLAGRVVRAGGGPGAGALVSDGRTVVVADELGLFELPVDARRPARELRAVLPGTLPAVARASDAEDPAPAWPDVVELRLGPAPLSLHGRLVDSRGRGLGGVRVWLDDPTIFQRPAAGEVGDLSTRVGMVPLAERPRVHTVEGALAGAQSTWSYVHTDGDGAFALEGLDDRAYVLGFLDVRTLLHMRSAPVRAGTSDLVVEWRPGPVHAEVAGTVRTRDGRALAGLDVSVLHTAFRIEGDGGGSDWAEQLIRATTATDAEGRFRLSDVPVDAGLLVEGRGVVATQVALGSSAVDDLSLVVPLYARLTVELGDGLAADRLRLLDADGRELAIHEVEGPQRRAHRALELAGSRTGVLFVPVEATRLVLERDGAAVREEPLALVEGEMHALRLE